MIGTILQQVFFKTVGITIFHSLWQATLLVSLTFAILKIFRRMAPSSKYLLLFGTSCMILTSAMVTFIIYYQQYSMEHLLVNRFPVQVNMPPENGPLDGATLHNPLTAIDGFITANAKALFYSWFLGVVCMIVWFTGGWIKTRNISRYYCQEVKNAYSDKFNLLIENMGIKKKIIFKETSKIMVPALIGWLKPAVLLPAGMLGNLPALQLEAIIAHELAHLKRGDYLTSMLQQAINILLFYHPAIWWISAAMDKERELAADVMALKYTGNKTAYVKALATFQEILINNRLLATAFSGKKSSFFKRIIHIINMKHMKPTVFEKSFLLVIVILGILALIGGTKLNNGSINEAALIPPVDLNLLVNNKSDNTQQENQIDQIAHERQKAKTITTTNHAFSPVEAHAKKHTGYMIIEKCNDTETGVNDILRKTGDLIHAGSVVNLQFLIERIAGGVIPNEKVTAKVHTNDSDHECKDTIKQNCEQYKNEEEIEVVLHEVEKTIQEIDIDAIVEESLEGIDINVIVHDALSGIDWDEIQYQIKVALEEVNEATAELQDEEFRRELEKSKADAREAIEEIDSEEIKRELEDARREIEKALEEIEIQRQRMKEIEQENAKQMEIKVIKEMKADSARVEETLKELEDKK